MPRLGWAASLALTTLWGCATTPPVTPGAPSSTAVELASLPGWADEDHAAALAAVRAGCGASTSPPLAQACRDLRTAFVANPRAYLEQRFVAERIAGEGLLTGYYAPEHQARTRPTPEFSAPLRARPADLVTGSAEPYLDRAAIESQPLRDADVLAWMRPEELFFLQIQGSGGLTFEDGRRRRAAFAAHNGRPFVGIAKPMRERGLLADDQTSASNIQAWLAANRGPVADALMRENPRYVFFTLAEDDGAHPAGAAGVPLPAGRGVAVDPAHHAYGQPLWIDADAGALAGAFPRYRRLGVALDTGGAIKGEVRGDLYIGRGPEAGVEAGRIRHGLRLWRLVPRAGGVR